MKRLAAGLSVLLLMLLPLTALGGDGSYLDTFPENDYDNSAGSLAWTAPWSEMGESDGPAAGMVRVVTSSDCQSSGCIRIDAPVALTGRGLSRTADLTGVETAVLSARIKRVPGLGILAVGLLNIQARSEGGRWDTIDTLDLIVGDASPALHKYALDAYAGGPIEIRFRVDTALLVQVFIDDVEIEVSYPPPTTTTTTTTTTTSTTTLPTTTSTTAPPATTSTTIRPTTTTLASTTTTRDNAEVAPTDPGGPGDGSDDGVAAAITEEEFRVAAANNIAVNLSTGLGLDGFAAEDIDPITGLMVNLDSTVEAISTQIVGALILGTLLAVLAVRRVKDEEDPGVTKTCAAQRGN